MALGLIGLPMLMAAVAFATPSSRLRPWLLPLTGLAHLSLALRAITADAAPEGGGWILLDPLGKLVLGLVSVLFCVCSFYCAGYLRDRRDKPNRVFCACLLAFLGMMSLVASAQHFGLLWVAIEATTLATAPLIYFNRSPRSLEAVWKYLLVGSVGIALALLGSFFLAYAALHGGLSSSLRFDDLLLQAPHLSKPWLHAAFVLLLVGYGTKMGLAPMHTWKPDAYGEAPGVVGALLAGGVTNCAFLAILRVHHLCGAAGEGAYSGRLLVLMGLLSMAIAGIFMVGQRDFKRMLAYSSVEHMGILVLGIGVGGAAAAGALFHVVNNGVTKGVLFLSAGNIHRAFGSKSTDEVAGALRRLPLSAWLFLAGFFAITGSPPFGPFLSEFAILNGTFGAGRFVVGAAFLFFLLFVFVGMGATVLRVALGRPPAGARATTYRDGPLTCAPIVLLLGLALLFGLHPPDALRALLDDAARFLETRP
jgi:hydrogenase-4 component F